MIKGLSNREVIVEARDVLFMPSIRENLMSVKKLTIAGVEVLFNGKIVTAGVVIATGHPRGNLYVLKLEVHRVS